jgi:DNA-binding transcriptional MerR regulator
MSIGELAARARLSVSAVRFYSDRGLLPPADVDAMTGYRSYDEEQVEIAVLIRDLRQLGMGLADVESFLGATASERRRMLDGHLRGLERQLADARSAAGALHVRLLRSEHPMTTITIDTVQLGHALDQVLPAAGRDLERPVLQCVLVEAKEGSLRLVATDSYRLAVRDLVTDSEAASFRALVPAQTLARWRDALPATGDVVLGTVDEDLVLRGADDTEHRVRTVPATYPAYEALLAAEADAAAVIVDRAELLDALERFPGEGDAVLLEITDGRMAVIRLDERVEIPARWSGPTLHVAVNPSYAAAAITGATGPDVVIEIVDPLRPVVFRSADDGTFTSMLMPIRLA